MSNLVYANVINVPANQPTIQAAINAAANGDTVQVAPGTYQENINFSGKAITVAGAQTEIGPQTSLLTVIEGGHRGSVVTFSTGEGPQSVLTGFTIQNGTAAFDGGGIQISNSSPTISINNIQNNTANANGGGIYVNFGSPIIHDNLISNNSQTAGYSGGNGQGIYIGGASAAQVIHNQITNNRAAQGPGGGIALFAAGAALVQGNYIGNNSAYNQGGGIWIVNDSSALIANNVIYGNSAPAGGGIYWLVPSGSRGPYAVNNTIADNTGSQGPAIFANGFQGQAQIINNVLTSAGGSTPLYCDGIYSQTPPKLFNNDVFSGGGAAYGGICAGMNGTSGNLSADPLFSNNLFQYGLAAGSPAIDSGTSNQAPSTDLNQRPRPLDGNGDGASAFDMGAYEMQTLSSVAVTSSLNPASTAQNIIFTATVTPTFATGTMQFLDGAASLGSVPVISGSGSLSTTLAAAGTHYISATFTSNNPSYTGYASTAMAEVVKTATGASLAASPAQPVSGQAVTLSASVSPATATGTVQFLDGTTPLGALGLSGGKAQLTISTFAAGNHPLTAVYTGDANFAGSTSALMLKVSNASPNISVTATPNPVVFGQSEAITVSLTPNLATGTVQLMDGSVSLGTATVVSGVASFATSALIAGTHIITGVYSGDSNYNGGTSPAISLVVNRIPVSISVSSSANPSNRNKPVTFTAVMTPSSAPGNIQFFDGGALLGTFTLSAGKASLTTSSLAVGTHSITAVYPGSQNFASGTSPVLSQVVKKP